VHETPRPRPAAVRAQLNAWTLGCVRSFRTFLSGVIALTTVGTTAAQAATEAVWRWFGSCPRPFMMRLEVDLDGAMLKGYSIPICQVDRFYPSRDSRIFKFAFHARHRIVWTGYRNTENTTDPSQEIEGNIWQAGGEADALILGVSFAVKDTLMMNTLHVAGTANESKTEIVKGLFVRTRPIKASPPTE